MALHDHSQALAQFTAEACQVGSCSTSDMTQPVFHVCRRMTRGAPRVSAAGTQPAISGLPRTSLLRAHTRAWSRTNDVLGAFDRRVDELLPLGPARHLHHERAGRVEDKRGATDGIVKAAPQVAALKERTARCSDCRKRASWLCACVAPTCQPVGHELDHDVQQNVIA